MSVLKFPKGFLWGSATSAYQVEGGIDNSDWSKAFSAGKACDHYNRYEEDFQLLQDLSQNAYRFSIEWSRIEPQEGVFDEKEIEHYRKVLESLKEKNIMVMLTLHHFSTPLWLADMGGWNNKKVVFYFSRFAQKVFAEYKDLVDFWITINEPTLYAIFGYFIGSWVPRKKNLFLAYRVTQNQIAAHKVVYSSLHQIMPDVRIGVAKSYTFKEPYSSRSLLDRLWTRIHRYVWNEYFLRKIKKQMDFIGINYYFHEKIKFPFYMPRNDDKVKTDVDWGVYPEGIYHVLKDVRAYKKPLYITENGLADAKDRLRKDFIKDHLKWIHKALSEGIDVRGYFYWSLMDNFEWEKGYDPRFGLVEIDYETFKRTPRPSARYYEKICKTNQLEL